MKNLVLRIAHSAYHTAQMDNILDFYCNKLEFKHAFSLKNDNGQPWIEYIKIADGTFIEFFHSSEEQVKNGDSRYAHLCIQVSDINATAEFLNAKGVTITSGPSVGKDKNSQCWCVDPDGNRIEFMCISNESPQAQA